MSKYLKLPMILAIATIGFSAPLNAQSRTAVSSAELDAALVTSQASQGQAVRELLLSDQAQQLAGRMGVGPAELSTRVEALDEAALNRLAERAQVDDKVLAGGDQVVILSTTAIIIFLLLLILLTS